jgi:hypothetical protein
MDGDGYLYVFINSHGPDRYHSFVYRSTQPHDISGFVEIAGKNILMDPTDIVGAPDDADTTKGVNFSYSHPWYLPGADAFVFLHSKYASWSDRDLAIKIGTIQPDKSVTWTNRQTVAKVEKGHYMVSGQSGETVGMAFNLHPTAGGLDARTNLYYCRTTGTGAAFETVDGTALSIPMSTRAAIAPALVHDYEAEGLLVYLKDLQFDTGGNPVILFATSTTASASSTAPRTWRTARWTGSAWEIRVISTSDHNYDHGSLWIEADGGGERWRLIAPLGPGPQPGMTGGEMQTWESTDQGATWQMTGSLGGISPFNNTFARRVIDGHADCTAIFADGDPSTPGISSIYFCNEDGTSAWRLPRRIEGDEAYPEPVAPGTFSSQAFFEGESFLGTATATAPLVVQNQTDGASNDQWLHLQATGMGDYVELPLTGITDGTYEVRLRTKVYFKRGIIQPTLNGANFGDPIDCYAATASYQTFSLGEADISGGGPHALRFTVTGKNAAATEFHASIDTITFVPVNPIPTPSGTTAAVLDATSATLIGAWDTRADAPGLTEGPYYLHDQNSGKGSKKVTWQWTPAESGLYEIALRWSIGSSYPWNGSPDRAHNTPVTVTHPGGQTAMQVDQREGDGFWCVLGRFQLHAGMAATVEISNTGTSKPVVADAVRFHRLDDPTLEGWKSEHFSAAELGNPSLEPTLWGIEADPDGDGEKNIEEYFRGHHPRVADAVSPTITLENDVLKYRYEAARWRTDVSTQLESSTDLSNWSVVSVAAPTPVDWIDGKLVLGIEFETASDSLFLRQRFHPTSAWDRPPEYSK